MSIHELEVLAPAKVNLFLSVLGKRADGYHDIVSVMQKLSLADRLHLCLAGSGITLRCPSSKLPEDCRNLVWKAARLFFDLTGIKDNVRITLHKAIPIAAGLGGGSSDAAAILLGLNRLCAAGVREDALLGMAARLGADVPFFVSEMDMALATGTGTDLQPIAGPADHLLVLVNPGMAVSTRWVYENLILTSADNPYKLSGYFRSPEEVTSLLAAVFECRDGEHRLFNDLERVTIGRHPIIGSIKEQLLHDGASAALMSGSGPTVFGLFRSLDMAEAAYNRFRQLYQDVFLVTPLK